MQRGFEEQAIFNESYYKKQFELLKYMYQQAEDDGILPLEAKYTVAELVEGSVIKDSNEVLRVLYIMEGQKLVSPYPRGDFTSAHWCLTEYGAEIAQKLITGVVDVSELW